jgi:hypothetical protein
MNDLVEFLLARFAKDKAVAHEALSRSSYGLADSAFEEAGELAQGEGARAPALTHIERWDPTHVLAEVESKRQVVDEYEETRDEAPPGDRYDGQLEALERVVRILALPYAGHGSYREEWRP